MTKQTNDSQLAMSSARALWGAVPLSLLSVSVEIRSGKIVWQCVFDSSASEDDIELLSVAAAEVIADFPEYGLEEIMKKVPSHGSYENLKIQVYSRLKEGNNEMAPDTL